MKIKSLFISTPQPYEYLYLSLTSYISLQRIIPFRTVSQFSVHPVQREKEGWRKWQRGQPLSVSWNVALAVNTLCRRQRNVPSSWFLWLLRRILRPTESHILRASGHSTPPGSLSVLAHPVTSLTTRRRTYWYRLQVPLRRAAFHAAARFRRISLSGIKPSLPGPSSQSSSSSSGFKGMIRRDGRAVILASYTSLSILMAAQKPAILNRSPSSDVACSLSNTYVARVSTLFGFNLSFLPLLVFIGLDVFFGMWILRIGSFYR